MLKRNPLTEDEHVRVASLMREIDDLSKRGRMYASTGGTAPETLRKAARAYNDRVAVLRVLIGNRPVERLEQKWLYGPVAWSMIVGQEWNAVVRPRERARAGVACNPSTCRNPKHRHAARRNPTTPGQGPPKRPRSWPSPKEIVTAGLVRLGLSPHRLSVKRVGFSDLARGSRLFVTIHDWKGDPRAQELKEIGRQNGFTVSFSGPGMVGNPSRHRAARKNTDIAGAMIAGASAALVGRLIRGNPFKTCAPCKRLKIQPWKCRRCGGFFCSHFCGSKNTATHEATCVGCIGARKNFRSSRIRRRPKPGECEIGLVSQDNCYRKATVDVEMGLKRGTPLHVCQRHADWIKRMKGNPGGARRNPMTVDRPFPPVNDKRLEVFWMSGKQAWHAGPFKGRPAAEEYVKRYKAGWKGAWPLRHVIMSYKQWGESGAPTSAPEWMRAWQSNPCGSRRNPGEADRIAKEMAIALARKMGMRLVDCGGYIHITLPHKPVDFASKPIGHRWYQAYLHIKSKAERGSEPPSRVIPVSRYTKKGGVRKEFSIRPRPGPYGSYIPNPLAGRWKGWNILPDQSGFVRRLSSHTRILVYLDKRAPTGKPWAWSVVQRARVVSWGHAATDEIAKKAVLASVRRGVLHKNPDELTGTMIVKCSTCKCVIRTEPCIQEFDGKISHGFCPTHLKEEQEKVKAWIASRKARNNPPSKKEMATWPKCVTCGKPAGFSVDWLYPQRVPDERPCCSSQCAVAAVKKGRSSMNPSVSKKIPAYQIRNWVGKFHVLTSNQQVEDALKAQIAKSKDPRWTPATIRQALTIALKAHNANRTQYRQVMSGRF